MVFTDPNIREAFQLLLALGLGAIVGLERRLRGHPAGIHTNALVSLGSAAFVVAGLALGSDVSRVAAQVVTGSGFICGGVILHQGTDIRGLNTAATLWCSVSNVRLFRILERVGNCERFCLWYVLVQSAPIEEHRSMHFGHVRK